MCKIIRLNIELVINDFYIILIATVATQQQEDLKRKSIYDNLCKYA